MPTHHRMPPRMAKEEVAYAGHAVEEEDATLSTNPLMQPQPAFPASPPGPFHPSLLRKDAPTTPRWGALALMALALLALEASILLGVTDVWRVWGGAGGARRGDDRVGVTAGAGESCQTQAAVIEAGAAVAAAAGPFAGLRQWMGEQHEATALWARYNGVVDEYESFLEERERAGGVRKAKGWTLLSASKDGRLRVSLRWPDAGNPGQGAPMLIAEGLYYNATAQDLFEAMRVRSTLRTMPVLDPFFEGYEIIKAYSPQVELGRRTTKRLLVYGKRDFIQGSIEEEGRKRKRRWRGLGLEDGKGGFHPREWVSASLSLPEAVQQDPAGPFHSICRERPGYTRAFQDLVGFYTPVPHPSGPAAAATLIMRMDLRGHIPHWIFSKTAGHTGMHLLHALHKMAGALDRPPRR